MGDFKLVLEHLAPRLRRMPKLTDEEIAAHAAQGGILLAISPTTAP